MKNNKLIVGISVVALILAGIALYKVLNVGSDAVSATPGSLPIENYVPVVKQNGGIYSELPIQTTSTLTAADATLTDIAAAGIVIGTGGTELNLVLAGSCAAATTATSIVATSTATHTCAVTGVTAGDQVLVQLPLSGASFGALQAVSATTTTSNVISFEILNLSGVATSSYPQATSSVSYWVWR